MTTYVFKSGYTKVRTTSGKTRSLSVHAGLPYGSLGAGATNVDVILFRHNGSFSQEASNDWHFDNLAASDFNPTGGNATVSLRSSEIGPFGHLSGTFTHSESHPVNCSSGSETDYTGSLVLKLSFRTKNFLESKSKLGRVHGRSGSGGAITFPNTPMNTSALSVDKGCVPVVPSSKTYCMRATLWASPFPERGKFVRFAGVKESVASATPSRVHQLLGFRTVGINGLPASGGADGTEVILLRNDDVIDEGSQSYSRSSTSPYRLKEVANTSTGDSYMQGSATLRSAGSTYDSNTGSCFAGSAVKREHLRSGSLPYSWTNGPTPLTGDSAVGGNLTLSSKTYQSPAWIYHYSY